VPLVDDEPRELAFFMTCPPVLPALLPVACWTHPVIVTGDP
jgi:hypothetical protein